MNREEAVKKLKELERNMHAYEHAMSALMIDGVTAAPAGSAQGRGETLGVLSEAYHNIFINDGTGELLDFLIDNKDSLDYQTVRETELLKEDYDRESKIPIDEYVAYRKLTNESDSVWHKAKAENDFDSFKPYLEKLVEANIRIAGHYDSTKKPYDVLLGLYEKGYTTEELDTYFSAVKSVLVPLVKATQESDVIIDDSFLYKNYPIDIQRKFSDYLMSVMGIDRNYCSIGETEHPFTDSHNKHDVRITTKYNESSLASSMYSVIHEGGHALYELNLGDELNNTRLAQGISMGIHESQSRFYENIIGRSREFISCIFPKMKELFPEQLSGVNAETFYLAVNKSTPSLIRTEADELTYSLHIMVRYEIEKKLMSGEVKVAELPEIWNEMMQKYLGISVPDDRQGVLQDSHWAGGSFGYFPSYSLGSAYGAQILSSMQKELDVFTLAENGNIPAITAWLTDKIFKYGSELTPKEAIHNCCNADFDSKFYTDYLSEKFSKIYKL